MLAQGCLGDSEFFGQQQRADAVLDQVAVDLRREMRTGILEPVRIISRRSLARALMVPVVFISLFC